MPVCIDAIAERIAQTPAHFRPTPDYRAAAVLLLLVPDEDGLCVPMIERPTTMSVHAGQIALPGGRIESGDRDAVDAALRETEEEVGVPREAVRLLGTLGHFPIAVSRFDVLACVGTWRGGSPLVPQPGEVDAAFPVALDALHREHVRHFAGQRYGPRDYPEYRVDAGGAPRRIWGATARILHHFLDTVYSPLVD